MLKRFLLGALTALTVSSVAFAQSSVLPYFYNSSNVKVPVGSGNPLPITGSITANLGGFAPNGSYTTLTATAASSASTTLPTGTDVALQNTSMIDVSCVLDATAATATTNKIVVRGGATVFVTIGLNTKVACINQTGSASNVVAVMGGAGLGTNFGGGGAGGGAVTLASGAVSSGAYSSGSIASGAYASGSVASGAFASGSIASGAMVDIGAQADAACGTATGTCSLIALQKYNNTATGSSVPAGTNLIGDVNLRQGGTALSATNGIYANLLVGNAAVATGTGAQGATSPRVTVATDSATVAGSATVPAGTNRVGYTSDDPCTQKVKINKPFTTNGTSSVELVAVSGSTVVYVCSLSAIAAGATTVAFTTGTGTACATNNAAVIGSTTANIANSLSLAANGGLTLGSGTGTVAQGAASSALCMINGTNVYVSGNISYVQQ